MSKVVDLDKMRAAREEAKRQNGDQESLEAPVVRFGGKTFSLPMEVPLDTVEALVEIEAVSGDKEEGADLTPEEQGRMVKAFKLLAEALLGEDQFRQFQRNRPSFEDYQAFMEGALSQYGMTEGNSGASSGS